mmetsp:Transcript_16230/g.13807  ORF Transcript_16230/g.13807 Transcript_16230/m.13807 type:complete len:494 (-) Transcript_16230:1315-2796(-)
MQTERDTFVLSLAKFTNLTVPKEIDEKNIKCIKLLLAIASNYGHVLGSSWLYVIECLTRIDYYTHLGQDDPFYSQRERVSKNPVIEKIEIANAEIIKGSIDLNTIHYIFNKSTNFELNEIIDFITALCKKSEEELKHPTNPSSFSLQKIVEVADYNLDRIKFVWQKIWNIIKEHISNVAINSSTEISMFAVDSLKQLSTKFLKKQELATHEFQREFLQPFETIFIRVKNDDTKNLILDCCNFIASNMAGSLKSGWKSIFDILGHSIDTHKETLIKFAFSILQRIMKENPPSLQERLSDLIVLLVKFAKCKYEDISSVSLKNVKERIDTLIKNFKEQKQKHNSNKSEEAEAEANGKPEKKIADPKIVDTKIADPKIYGISQTGWVGILQALLTIFSNKKLNLHQQSIEALFDILALCGDEFPQEFWHVVTSGVIKPLFDEIQFFFQSDKEKPPSVEACENALKRTIDVHHMYYSKLDYFTEDLFNTILGCATIS